MDSIPRYLAQAMLFAVFFAPLAVLTHWPVHRHLAEDMAVLKVAVRHAGAIVGECTPIGSAEYSDQPVNMQRTEICPTWWQITNFARISTTASTSSN